jgi:LysR family transcriptional regulator, glycine cleavage system transcriptional activator
MTQNLRNLPPARTLMIFETAGRMLNFSAAARQIGLSQVAVSKQVQLLEAAIGAPLFVRSNRGLTLTAAGRRLHQAVSVGLGHIRDALEEIRPRFREGQVTITTTIALASVWLMPRIAKYRAAHPTVDLRVIATDEVLNLEKEGVDVALRYGLGQWAGANARALFGVELFPVCSPGFLASSPQLKSLKDLSRSTLLHLHEPNTNDADWKVWLKAVGGSRYAETSGLQFNNYPLLIQAAVNGQGVALGWGHLIDDLLANGSLVQCLPNRLLLKPAFFVVTAAAGAPRTDATAFSDWIVEETANLRDADIIQTKGHR